MNDVVDVGKNIYEQTVEGDEIDAGEVIQNVANVLGKWWG